MAIAGLGGVGGSDLVALARLGIGKFTIADPDVFEMRNTTQQYGATRSTEGHLKAEVMRDIVLNINPEAQIRRFCERIGRENALSFMAGADVFIDAMDASEIKMRRLLYRMARQDGIFALGASPAPYFHQFDAYHGIYVRKRLRGGSRHPLQRLERHRLLKSMNRSRHRAWD